jgi:hypothetical protein
MIPVFFSSARMVLSECHEYPAVKWAWDSWRIFKLILRGWRALVFFINILYLIFVLKGHLLEQFGMSDFISKVMLSKNIYYKLYCNSLSMFSSSQWMRLCRCHEPLTYQKGGWGFIVSNYLLVHKAVPKSLHSWWMMFTWSPQTPSLSNVRGSWCLCELI